jgi:16S rRNA (guanine527-N7)-methyltransferase
MIDSEEEARSFVAERCDAAALSQLDHFVLMLEKENARQNLISKSSLSQVWQRHVADSAQLLDIVPRETGPWLDLGTGAGFPGLVASIMRPEIMMVLVEPRRKRADWLTTVIGTLGLKSCRVEAKKVEDLEAFPAGVISARAFARLDRLVVLAKAFSTSDTVWLLPKGRSAAQEVTTLPKDLRGSFHVEQSVTDFDSGIVVGRMVGSR